MQSRIGGKDSVEVRRQSGLAGMLLQLWANRRSARTRVVRQMELLETLPLGGKRQLMLVQCAGERFLIGGNLDSIETIVKIYSQDESLPQGGQCK